MVLTGMGMTVRPPNRSYPIVSVIVHPPTTIGGEHYVFGSSVRPSVR